MGLAVGLGNVGAKLGAFCTVGRAVGCRVVGSAVGDDVGLLVGDRVGLAVGAKVGACVGNAVGL